MALDCWRVMMTVSNRSRAKEHSNFREKWREKLFRFQAAGCDNVFSKCFSKLIPQS